MRQDSSSNKSSRICFELTRISKSISKKAEKIALAVSKSFNHVGLLAVELFLTSDGDILVNEVAPRPHNSMVTIPETESIHISV